MCPGSASSKRRPAAVRVELGVRAEQLGAAGPAPVDAPGLGVGVLARPRRLGAGLAQHPELGRGEAYAPLVLGGRQLGDGQLTRHVNHGTHGVWPTSVTKPERFSLVRHGGAGGVVSFRPTPAQALGRGAYLGGWPGTRAVPADARGRGRSAGTTCTAWLAGVPVLSGIIAGGLLALIFGRADGADIDDLGIHPVRSGPPGPHDGDFTSWRRVHDLRCERRRGRTQVVVVPGLRADRPGCGRRTTAGCSPPTRSSSASCSCCATCGRPTGRSRIEPRPARGRTRR